MRRIFILLMAVFVSSGLFANPITQKQAEKVAYNFYQNVTVGIKTNVAIDNVTMQKYNGIITYYTIRFKEGGFVVVAADDASTPILAYSEEGNMPENITNAEVKWWLEGYNKQIEYIVDNNLDNTQTLEEWNRIRNRQFAKGARSVTPLLTTTWDQETGYNTYCPGGYTGCVATAMSQIMNYHEFPVTGAKSHKYTHPTYGDQSADFSSVNYDWASMPDNSGSDAVAVLMRHAGVAVDMDYSTSGSGAMSRDVQYVMANYFKYDQAIRQIQKADYSDALWISELKNELDNSRPIYYSGSGTAGGHAFVFDGYDATDKFHVNWGWSGSSNGYFAVGALNAGGYQFNDDNAAIIGIQPSTALNEEFLAVKKFSDLSNQTANASPYIGYIDAVSDNVAWGVARDGSGSQANYRTYTKTSDGGNTWTAGKVETLGGTAFSMICGLDENTAYIAMWGDNQANNKILKTTDGGTNWTSVLEGGHSLSFFNVVHFFDTNNGFAQGDPDSEFELYTTSDAGASWTRVDGANIPDPINGEYGITGMYTAVGDNIWFTTNKGRVYKSTDKGLNWTVSNIYTGPNGTYIDIAFSDNATTGLALITLTSGTSVVGYEYYKTVDGGDNWTQIATHNGTFYDSDISAIPGTDGAFISVGADATTPKMGMSYTEDGGDTWIEFSEYYQDYQLLSVDMVSWDKGFIGSFAGDWTDGAWSLYGKHSPELKANFIVSDVIANGDSIFCANSDITFTNNSQGLVDSYAWDFGANATPATATGAGPHTVQFSTAGEHSVVLTVYDAASNDNVKTYTVKISETLPVLSEITGATTVASGGDETYTTDATTELYTYYNWEKPSYWTGASTTNIIDLHFTNAFPGVLKVNVYNGCGESNQVELNINDGSGINSLDNTISISPNPTTDFVNIVAEKTITNIIAKNITGQEVLNVNPETNEYKANLSELVNGVYLFTIKTENQTITKRVIVE